MIRRIFAWREHYIGPSERQPSQHRKRFPHLHAVRANNRPEPRRNGSQGLRHRSQIRVPHQNYLPVTCCRANRRRHEPRFAALTSRKDEFLATHSHAVQFRGVVQAQQPALHVAAGREFAQHGRQVSARPLHPTRPL
jgi:hypothetical protein